MKKYIKEQIGHLIYKTIGTPSFIRRIEWKSVLEYLDPKECERILDVACGGGVLSLKIAERGCKIHGIDTSEDSVKRAKRLAEKEGIICEFVVGSAENLPYPNECFNKIVCSSSLEHFKDDVKALKEMHRVLKPKGIVILSTDSFTYPISDELKERHREIAYVVNYYTRETLKERFKISGFEINQDKYLLNSRISSFFFNIGIKLKWSGLLWVSLSLLAYPLCLLSDKFSGVKDEGYSLVVKAQKHGLHPSDWTD